MLENYNRLNKSKNDLLLEEYKAQYEYNKNFMLSNDWSKDKGSKFMYSTEEELVKSMLSTFVSFLDELGSDAFLEKFKNFSEYFLGIMNIHTDRIDHYIKENNNLYTITEDIENLAHKAEDGEIEVKKGIKDLEEKKLSEIKFRSNLFAQKVNVKTRLSNLNIISDSLDLSSPKLYYADMKASLLMRPILVSSDNYVKTRTESLDIDFNVAHTNPASSNQMLINMKDVPPYDPNKHYFEQDKDVIQFWEEERIKMKKGITIGGEFIHPFLYWHLNIFKTTLGSGENKRVDHPLFWDNEYYFIEVLKKAEEIGNVGIFMYGSRRTAKSVKMTSFTQWKLHTIPHARGTLIGFSEDPDLKAIWDYTNVNINYMYPAFKVESLTSTMDKGIELGIRKMNQNKIIFGKCEIVNLGGGKKTGNLKTAGATPDFFAIDEASKGAVTKPWNAALASFSASDSDKWRTVPLLSATAGDEDLSEDAEKILSDPESYNVLPMDWDLYDQHVSKEYRTWERETFSTFIPAQLSLEAPKKKKTNLSTFLGVPNKDLEEVEIHVTDWEKASPYFKLRQEKLQKNPQQLANEKKNFPIAASDCLLSTEYNRYPANQAKRHKLFLIENELIGRPVEFEKDMKGNITVLNSTKKPVSEYPFGGGNYEAPVMLLDEIEKDHIPPFALYVIGLDDVKHKRSDGDSLFSVTMYKRKYKGGQFADRIAAYYHTRSYKKEDAYKQTYLLMKKYNAIVMPENDDEGFVEYVQRHYPRDMRHISDGVDFATLNNLHRNPNRPYGMSTDPRNLRMINSMLEHYTKREDFIIDGVDGMTGIQAINDPMLLEEMYKNKPGKNADRIRSAAIAISFGDFLDKYGMFMSETGSSKDSTKNKKKKVKMVDWYDNDQIDIW